MDDPDASLISESEVLEESVASAAAGGSGARSYGSTVAKLVQPMESKTPGSARNALRRATSAGLRSQMPRISPTH